MRSPHASPTGCLEHTDGGGPRVGIVLARYPVLSETFILRELHELWRTGMVLSIYAFGSSPDALSHPMVNALKVPVITLPERHRRLHIARAFAFWSTRAPKKLLQSLRHTGGREAMHAAMGALYLARQAIPLAPQHFHAHYLSSPAAAARTMAILHGTTFSATAHAHDIFLSDPDELGMRIRQAAWVRTISRYNRRLLLKMAGHVPRRRVQVVRIGVDLGWHEYQRPNLSPTVCRITTIGRLVAIKGVDVLLRALSLIPRDRWVLSVAGTGPMEGSLRALSHALKIENSVHFLGPLVQEQIRELLTRTDLFVLAAHRDESGNMDGLPVVLVEALASGVPSISTTLSGIPELLATGAGVLVKPDEPEELATAISRLMGDASLRRRVSECGRRRVERGWDLRIRCNDLARRLKELCDPELARPPDCP